MNDRIGLWFDRLLTFEGSTRVVGLLRIGLVLLAWSRWANELQPFRDSSVPRIAIGIAFYVSTCWMLVGWWSRLATAGAALVVASMIYGFGQFGGVSAWSSHHQTLLVNAFLLLALTPNGRSLSLDRWLEVRAAEREGRPAAPERGPLWGQILLSVQVSTLYFWSAVDKTSVAFLSGTRLEQIFTEYYASSDWSPPGWARLGFPAAAVTVVCLEYVLAFGLWNRRLRRVLIPVGLLLHGVFYVLIDVATFTLTMWLLYLTFLDPDAVHRVIDQLVGPPALKDRR